MEHDRLRSHNDRAKDSNGNVVCQNRTVLFGKVRWGKIMFYKVYENAEKVKALDEYPARQEISSGTAVS